ncbi:hypothetical protein [Streptomyces sp. NPDC127084]|uniref:hypothetical protein n=1 Tax=Streptomyces sp. NPDC127084 TaxID=3347133 RepID=UPI0036514933
MVREGTPKLVVASMHIMELEEHRQPAEAEGCLTVAVRIPVRIVVLLVVVPVRMVWDLLVLGARTLNRVLLRPIGRALAFVYDTVLAPVGRAVGRAVTFLAKALFYWPWLGLWRYVIVPVAIRLYRWVLAPLGRGLGWVYRALLVPVAWAVFVWPWTAMYRWVLTPLGHGLVWVYRTLLTPLGRGAGWLVWAVFVWPWTALYRWVLTPLGRGLAWVWARAVVPAVLAGWAALVWLLRVLFVVPAVCVYRWILVPVGRFLAVLGRETADAFKVAWRIAGYVSRAAGRALKWLVWNLLGRPLVWCYREVCTPVGHFVRDQVWRPAKRAAVMAGRAVRGAVASARDSVREARRAAWRALVGGPAEVRGGEPVPAPARNLGGTSTTVSGAAPGPGVSLHKRG